MEREVGNLGRYVTRQKDSRHEQIDWLRWNWRTLFRPRYRTGDVNTNSIESVWAVMKRGMYGVYHHASPKHLHRYVDEFTFRLNDGDVKRHTLERLDSFIKAVDGKRLTYARLIQ